MTEKERHLYEVWSEILNSLKIIEDERKASTKTFFNLCNSILIDLMLVS